MNFACTIVHVADVAASLAFFERAFSLSRHFLHESYAYGGLETSATSLSAPLNKPWGQTAAYLRCPAGTLVELCTPMA